MELTVEDEALTSVSQHSTNGVWWCVPVTPALSRQRRARGSEDQGHPWLHTEFEASLVQ